jgi:hypothetical protein
MRGLGEAKTWADKVTAELDVQRMWDDLQIFSQLHRYSGSDDGEKAVDIIVNRMKTLDIQVARERYDLYRSLPLEATVSITNDEGKMELKATPYVYSICAANLTGPVVFDVYGQAKPLSQNEQIKRCEGLNGKIVLTYDVTYQFAEQACKAGALAILTIWPGDIPHHGTLGAVWGTPEPVDLGRYPRIPFVEIIRRDGEKLLALLRKSEVIATLDVKMDTRIVTSSMPVAVIPGESAKYVLVSGHYDSWYEGMTDNGVANVAMMDMARVLKQNQGKLKRTVVLAWWSGHSDGRYSGSTWYFDQHWQDLHDNCVAHINMDICGCAGSDLVGFNTSGMEGRSFSDRFLMEFNAQPPIAPVPMERFADQTFWGANVPLTIMPKFSKYGASAMPFFWWHTVQDSIDKVSPKIMLRDSSVILKLACLFANAEQLPVRLLEFATMMESHLNALKQQLHTDFDLAPADPHVQRLKAALSRLEKAMEGRSDTDDIIKRTAGELARITYSSSSPYHQDPAVAQGLFPALSKAVGHTPENTEAEYYLALKTLFVRQRNRLVGQIMKVIEECDNQLSRWGIVLNPGEERGR